MERRAFLEQLGLGAAFALTASCLGGCAKDTTIAPGSPVDFTLNLNDAANANLKTNEGYIVTNGVVVARTLTGGYASATVTCSHQGQRQITYNSQGQWYCTAHGALFSATGAGLNNNGSGGLTVYKTQLTDATLRIYS
jgi:cytochrome b6-f complex iron-sulfur subunit